MSAADPILRLIRKATAGLERRVRLMVARGVLELVDDSTSGQTLQLTLLADEVRDDIEHFHPYGLTSVPPVGSEALVMFVGGSRDHGIAAVVTDRTTRPTGLDAGEVALHKDDSTPRVKLTAGGEVHLGDSPANFVALANLVNARLASIQSTFDSHIHTTTATVGASAVLGVIAPPASPIGSLADVAAAEVKAI